jgi:hypothetical protein
VPFALLYVSHNRIPSAALDQELAKILSVSLAHNQARSITGALVSTPTRFAQVLEGPRGAVMALMKRIEVDPRHGDIAIVADEMLPERSFPRWSLAHIGINDALENAMAKVSDASVRPPAPGDVWALWNLMSELAHARFGADPSSSTLG